MKQIAAVVNQKRRAASARPIQHVLHLPTALSVCTYCGSFFFLFRTVTVPPTHIMESSYYLTSTSKFLETLW
jgi:hypothetical protein